MSWLCIFSHEHYLLRRCENKFSPRGNIIECLDRLLYDSVLHSHFSLKLLKHGQSTLNDRSGFTHNNHCLNIFSFSDEDDIYISTLWQIYVKRWVFNKMKSSSVHHLQHNLAIFQLNQSDRIIRIQLRKKNDYYDSEWKTLCSHLSNRL